MQTLIFSDVIGGSFRGFVLYSTHMRFLLARLKIYQRYLSSSFRKHGLSILAPPPLFLLWKNSCGIDNNRRSFVPEYSQSSISSYHQARYPLLRSWNRFNGLCGYANLFSLEATPFFSNGYGYICLFCMLRLAQKHTRRRHQVELGRWESR